MIYVLSLIVHRVCLPSIKVANNEPTNNNNLLTQCFCLYSYYYAPGCACQSLSSYDYIQLFNGTIDSMYKQIRLCIILITDTLLGTY